MKLGEVLLSLTTNIPNYFLFWFWRLGLTSFLSFQPVLITQQPIIMSFKFLILLKMWTVAIKIIKHQLLNVNWRHDINIFLKIINGLKLVYRFQNWTEIKLEMLFKSYTNISPSFIWYSIPFKRNINKHIFWYVVMSMMTSKMFEVWILNILRKKYNFIFK